MRAQILHNFGPAVYDVSSIGPSNISTKLDMSLEQPHHRNTSTLIAKSALYIPPKFERPLRRLEQREEHEKHWFNMSEP